MEFFVCILILFLIKIFEWSCALIKFMFKAVFSILTFPFKTFSKSANSKSHYAKPKQKKVCSVAIERTKELWGNSSKDLELEDIFWLDEFIDD